MASHLKYALVFALLGAGCTHTAPHRWTSGDDVSWDVDVPDAFVVDVVGQANLDQCREAIAGGVDSCAYWIRPGCTTLIVFESRATLEVQANGCAFEPPEKWSGDAWHLATATTHDELPFRQPVRKAGAVQ